MQPETQLPALDYSTLDPGVRETVKWLRAHGFNTTDSGDGYSKFEHHHCSGTDDDPCEVCDTCLDYPHVAMTVKPEKLIAESKRLRSLLEDLMIEVYAEAVGYDVAIEASYDPVSNIALIFLSGVNDQVLLSRN